MFRLRLWGHWDMRLQNTLQQVRLLRVQMHLCYNMRIEYIVLNGVCCGKCYRTFDTEE